MMILSRVTQIVPVNTEILTQMLGMSLAVQWLSLCALLQRAHIQFLVGELRSYMSCGTALPLKKKNTSALTPQPTLLIMRNWILSQYLYTEGLLRWLSNKESAYQYKRHKRCGFNSWVRKIPWRRKWQPTPVFSPGKFHGQKSLGGYSPWGCKESDMMEHSTGQGMQKTNLGSKSHHDLNI